jgi:hypothetical protein
MNVKGRYRRRWEDNNKMELTEIRCYDVDWIQWRVVVSTVMMIL